jgi:hypothetical protein
MNPPTQAETEFPFKARPLLNGWLIVGPDDKAVGNGSYTDMKICQTDIDLLNRAYGMGWNNAIEEVTKRK